MKMLMDAVRAEAPPLVMVWPNFMTLVLVVGGALFTPNHTTALLVFLSATVSLVVAIILYDKFRNIYVVGVTHIPLWGPLVTYIIVTEFVGGRADFSQPYMIRVATAPLVMIMSLIFDVRDLYLVATAGRGQTVEGN